MYIYLGEFLRKSLLFGEVGREIALFLQKGPTLATVDNELFEIRLKYWEIEEIGREKREFPRKQTKFRLKSKYFRTFSKKNIEIDKKKREISK